MSRRGELLKILGVVLVAVSLCPVAAAAQERPAPETSESAQQESGGKAGGDGIKVHGHWTIDVRNPDGTLASHNEFENALLPGGSQALAALLGKAGGVGYWRINLLSSGPSELCRSNLEPYVCSIIALDDPIINIDPLFSWNFPTLQIDVPRDAQSDQILGTIELSGNFTPSFAGSIGAALTIIDSRPNFFVNFSRRNLAIPIQVAAGQQVYVKVSFSFS